MSISFIVILALAIPIMLAGLLLPPLLLQDRMESASANFPDGLRKAIGVDRPHDISVRHLLIVVALFASSLAPETMQKSINIACAILLMLYTASRSRIYLKARKDYSGVIDSASSRILLLYACGSGLLSVLLLLLSIALISI